MFNEKTKVKENCVVSIAFIDSLAHNRHCIPALASRHFIPVIASPPLHLYQCTPTIYSCRCIPDIASLSMHPCQCIPVNASPQLNPTITCTNTIALLPLYSYHYIHTCIYPLLNFHFCIPNFYILATVFLPPPPSPLNFRQRTSPQLT